MARIVTGIRPEVEVVDTEYSSGPYERRWLGRESLVVILILALAIIWLYRNRGLEALGKQGVIDIQTTGSEPPVEIETAPVDPPVVAIPERPRVIIAGQPVVTVEQRPLLTAKQQSEITGYARVMSDSLNLRARPGFQYEVISVLPRNWELAVLRQSHVYPNGETWVEVMAWTNQGWRKGWVMRDHLDSCNCPIY
jgi:hypothetical protein